MIKINNLAFQKEALELLDSISYPEFEEFTTYTENLYRSTDGKYILETQYKRSDEWFAEELRSGELTHKDMGLKTEYSIISKEEATDFMEMAVWKV